MGTGTGEYPSVGVVGRSLPEPVPIFSQALRNPASPLRITTSPRRRYGVRSLLAPFQGGPPARPVVAHLPCDRITVGPVESRYRPAVPVDQAHAQFAFHPGVEGEGTGLQHPRPRAQVPALRAGVVRDEAVATQPGQAGAHWITSGRHPCPVTALLRRDLHEGRPSEFRNRIGVQVIGAELEHRRGGARGDDVTAERLSPVVGPAQ